MYDILIEDSLSFKNQLRYFKGQNSFIVRTKWNKIDLRWYFFEHKEIGNVAKTAFNF